jgi:hypothetical protein
MGRRERGYRSENELRVDASRNRREGDLQRAEGSGAFGALLVLGIALLAILCWTLGTAALEVRSRASAPGNRGRAGRIHRERAQPQRRPPWRRAEPAASRGRD